MNKTKGLLLLFVLMAASIIYVNAQKIDEGKIVFEISYPDADMPDEQMAMMPTEMTTYFKGNQAKTDMKMGMGMSQVMIFDNKNKVMTMLMDMMGNKSAIKFTEEDIKKQKEKDGKGGDLDIKKTDETKEIAGYKCKKAVVTNKDGSYDIYYTDEITYKNGDWINDYKGIEGFPLQYKTTQNRLTMQLTAKSVSKEKVDAGIFAIPADYKLMTLEEMQKMYGGGK
jgi:GLPGLI family protein